MLKREIYYTIILYANDMVRLNFLDVLFARDSAYLT